MIGDCSLSSGFWIMDKLRMVINIGSIKAIFVPVLPW